MSKSGSSISSEWFLSLAGTSETDREKLTGIVSSWLRTSGTDALRQLLKIRKEAIQKRERGVTIYSDSNWAYLIAHHNGELQIIDWLESLLKVETK